MAKWKWIAATAALAAVLAVGGIALLHRNERPAVVAEAASAAAPAEDADPVTRFRTEREQLRARETAQLNDIIHGGNADGETILMAQRQLIDLMRYSEQELTIEGVLQSRGFDGALVTVGDDSANVLIRAESVTQAESAVILELVMRETGISGGNVKIIPVN